VVSVCDDRERSSEENFKFRITYKNGATCCARRNFLIILFLSRAGRVTMMT